MVLSHSWHLTRLERTSSASNVLGPPLESRFRFSPLPTLRCYHLRFWWGFHWSMTSWQQQDGPNHRLQHVGSPSPRSRPWEKAKDLMLWAIVGLVNLPKHVHTLLCFCCPCLHSSGNATTRATYLLTWWNMHIAWGCRMTYRLTLFCP